MAGDGTSVIASQPPPRAGVSATMWCRQTVALRIVHRAAEAEVGLRHYVPLRLTAWTSPLSFAFLVPRAEGLARLFGALERPGPKALEMEARPATSGRLE